MCSYFINITDKTSNGIRINSLQRKATLVQLGGFPIEVKGFPETKWNPHGTLSHNRIIGGRVENAILMKLRGKKTMCQQTAERPEEEIPDLSSQFEELLKRHGHDNEETADIAKIIATELGLYEGVLQ